MNLKEEFNTQANLVTEEVHKRLSMNEIKITTSTGNVFADLELPDADKLLDKAKVNVYKKYLVKYVADYADEFDVYGLAVLTQEDKDYFDNLPEQQYCHSFGSTEEIEYETKAQLLSNYTWTELYKEEAELVIKLIGRDYGQFYYPYADAEEDWDEEVLADCYNHLPLDEDYNE